MSEINWNQWLEDPLAASPELRFDGRSAIIAGGGLSGPLGGIGFAIAWLLARGGARVAILDRDPEAAARTVAVIQEVGCEAMSHALDMTDSDAVRAAVDAVAERFGGIDLVADSIGGGGLSNILEAPIDEWDMAMSINVEQVWHLIRHSQRHLAPGGAIVAISSSAVEGRGPGLPYGIAKTALEKLIVGVAGTLAPRGIRANIVRVGMIWGAFAASTLDEELREVRRANTAMRTEGNSWDVAAAACFLLSRHSRWITGQALAVDGGGIAPPRAGQASRPMTP